jgi:arylsulfatase A-like enzyme
MRVLVVHTSALHLGYLGCYGSDWVTTPNLDRLAAEGVVFDGHFADRPEQHRGHNSHFSGRYRFPSPGRQEPAADRPSLLEIARSHGIDPLVLDDVGALGPELKRWRHARKALCWINRPSLSPPWNVPDEYLAPYFPTLDEDETLSPWLDPPAGPFDDEGSDRERVQATYAAQVSFFDAELGMLFGQLEEQGLLDDTLICVTASCGLALGEHGYIGNYRGWLHEEVVHVPLIFRLPGAEEAGLRLSVLTQPVDLPATLAAALELPAVTTYGFNLLPLVGGDIKQIRPYAFSGMAVGDSVEWSVRTLEWAYLLPLTTPCDDPPRHPQLFVKPDDRWEVNDVRQHYLELSEDLERELRSFAARVS